MASYLCLPSIHSSVPAMTNTERYFTEFLIFTFLLLCLVCMCIAVLCVWLRACMCEWECVPVRVCRSIPLDSPLNMNFSNLIYRKTKVMIKSIVSRGDAVWSPQYLSFNMEGRDEVWLPKTDLPTVILFFPFLESLTTYFLAHWNVAHLYTSSFLNSFHDFDLYETKKQAVYFHWLLTLLLILQS